MRWSLRLVALIFAILSAFIASARLELGESSVPHGVDASFTLSMASSTASKGEVRDALARIAEDAGAAIALVSLPLEDPTTSDERVLYSFGDVDGEVLDSRGWYAPSRDGGIVLFDAGSTIPLDGQYVIWGPPDVVDQVAAWAQPRGVEVRPAAMPSALQMSSAALLTGNAYIPLLALLLCVLVLVLVAAARETRPNAQKLLNGVPAPRIALEHAWRMMVTVLAPLAMVSAVAAGIVAVRSGDEFVVPYLLGLAHFLVPFCVAVMAFGGTLAVLTWPGIATIAHREAGAGAVVVASELTKIVSIAVTLSLLPTTLIGLTGAQSLRDEGALWERFVPGYAVNSFGTVAGSAEDLATGEAFRAMVADAGDDALLVMDFGAEMGLEVSELDPSHDAVVVVDSQYIEVALGAADGTADALHRELAPAAIPAPLRDALSATLLMQLSGSSVANPFTVLRPSELIIEDTFPVITGRYQEAMVLADDPLLLIVDDPMALSHDFLLAASSSSGVIFTDEDNMRRLLAKHGLSESATGIDSVATLGLLDLQDREQTLRYFTIAVLVLISATGLCVWISARAFVLANHRRFVPFVLSGVGFRRIFGRRLCWETSLIGGVTAAVAVITLGVSGQAPIALAAVAVGLAAAALSIALHMYEHQQLVGRALARKST